MIGRRAVIVAAMLALAGVLASAAVAPAASTKNRFSVVKGCYSLRSVALGKLVAKDPAGGYGATAGRAGAERFRLQATDLGTYLLYGKARDFLAADGSGTETAAEPSTAAEWRLTGNGRRGFVLRSLADNRTLSVARSDGALTVGTGGAGRAGRFRFIKASGCPRYPEIAINASGLPFRGATSYGDVVGTIDDHLHIGAYEFLGGDAHCGRPWHRYGAPYALVDCPDHYPNGSGAVFENTLSGNPGGTHDPVGWPTFRDWPAPRSQTHEQTYYRWMERAWRAGTRIIVNDLVENEVLCRIYPIKHNPCDDMQSIRLQAKRMRELQRYIDAQWGGPGKGWFRIVRNPFQARRVINAGKLALVLGVEVSRVFGCGFQNNVPQCDRDDVDRGLDEIERMGVASLFPIHKFDNGFGGVRFDSGAFGVAINNANRAETGQYWQIETCPGPEHDNEQTTSTPGPGNDMISQGSFALLPPGLAPVYPPPPHCNVRGLTPLGRYLINQMIRRGIMIELDHMGVKTSTAALAIAEAKRYSGLLASHTWSDPLTFRRIYALGGFVSPITVKADDFLEEWRFMRKVRSKRYLFGIGFGADSNGLHSQPDARGADAPAKVLYPFRSLDERVRFTKQRSGQRTYDVNVDGVAHYGLHADWFQDLRNLGGRPFARDLFRGAEAYLQTWERAIGVPGPRCLPAPRRFSPRGLSKMRLGQRPVTVLRRVGQPKRRQGRSYRWCARTKRKDPGARVAAAFTAAGKLGLVGSTARGHRLNDVGPDAPPSRVPDSARALGGKLFVTGARRGAVGVYGIQAGEIGFVALATPTIAASRASLVRYLELAGLR